MNKRVIIISVVGLVGVGAYFYFNSKLKTTTVSTGQETKNQNEDSLISVPSKGEVLSTPEEVLEMAQKITDAKGLASKLYLLRIERAKLVSYPTKSGISFLNSSIKLINDKKIKDLDQQIKDLEKLINALGYTELNGNIVKIV